MHMCNVCRPTEKQSSGSLHVQLHVPVLVPNHFAGEGSMLHVIYRSREPSDEN